MKSKSLFYIFLAITVFIAAGCIPTVKLNPVPGALPELPGFNDTPEDCNLDGIVDEGEECDDGNMIMNDECDRCRKTFCGDGAVQNFPSNGDGFAEGCDPGEEDENGEVPGTGMSAEDFGSQQCLRYTGVSGATCVIDECTCRARIPPHPRCNFDGVVDDGEECDDGNYFGNDGCHECKKTVCGDGVINNNPANSELKQEGCDPGEADPDTGFVPGTDKTPEEYGAEQCQNMTGEDDAVCAVDSCSCVKRAATTCGDGFIDGWPTVGGGWRGEGCDPPGGNAALGDLQCIFMGLGDTCNVNTCSCSGCNNDGVVDPGEACDDGNLNPNDGCDMCVPTVCGDGILDNNPANSQGITEQCEGPGLFWPGVKCKGKDEKCDAKKCLCVKTPGNNTNKTKKNITDDDDDDGRVGDDPFLTQLCGDGKVTGTEQCDVGGIVFGGKAIAAVKDQCPEGQSCSETCKCQKRVITPRCGDGYISDGEDCDLGGGRYASHNTTLPDTCEAPKECVQCKCTSDLSQAGCLDGQHEDELSCEEYCESKGTNYGCSEVYTRGQMCYLCKKKCESADHYADLNLCDDLCEDTGIGDCVKVGSLLQADGCYVCDPKDDTNDDDVQDDDVQDEEEEKSCEEVCTEGGHLLTKSDHVAAYNDYTLNELSKDEHKCKEVASITRTKLLIGECECWKDQEPVIASSGQIVCPDPACGTSGINCDDSVSCDDGSGGTVTVHCQWGGWSQEGDDYVSNVG